MNKSFAILLLVACSSGCSKPFATLPTEAKPDSGQGNTGKRDKNPATATADHKFSAKEWHDECQKKDAASKKYNGKIIEVFGEVSAVTEGGSPPRSYIHLKVEGEFGGLRFPCGVDDWKKAVPKSKVVLRGYSNPEYLIEDLTPCVVVESDAKHENFRAREISEELVKNWDAAEAKYAKKWCWIEGEYLSKSGDLAFLLKGTDGIVIECGSSLVSVTKLKAVKPGDAVRVMGQLEFWKDKKKMSIDDCKVE